MPSCLEGAQACRTFAGCAFLLPERIASRTKADDEVEVGHKVGQLLFRARPSIETMVALEALILPLAPRFQN